MCKHKCATRQRGEYNRGVLTLSVHRNIHDHSSRADPVPFNETGPSSGRDDDVCVANLHGGTTPRTAIADEIVQLQSNVRFGAGSTLEQDTVLLLYDVILTE